MGITAGIDTWSPCWYLDPDSSAGELMTRLATAKAARGTLIPYPVAGHRIGYDTATHLLYAEGHPGGPGELCSPADLPDALVRLSVELASSGVPIPDGCARSESQELWWDGSGQLHERGRPRADGWAGLRRVDATVDITPARAAEGAAILAGIAGVATAAPRSKAEVFFAADGSGAVETVYFRGYAGLKVLGRWYDKGVEARTHGRGLRVRAEDQRRYVKGARRAVTELTGPNVRAQFQRRYRSLWQASKGVHVASHLVTVDKIAEMAARGELSVQAAERLMGYVVSQRASVALVRSRRTSMRRRGELRELGLVLSDGVLEDVELDLADVLDSVMDGATWGEG